MAKHAAPIRRIDKHRLRFSRNLKRRARIKVPHDCLQVTVGEPALRLKWPKPSG
jgi:hypothetical protein